MDISRKLAQSNGRLKAGKVGCRIHQQGDRLVLRGTFPPRPGSCKNAPHQQRLFTGLRANGEGLRLAEQMAREIGLALQRGDFDWDQYINPLREKSQTVADWVERHRAEYLSQGGKQETWEGDYWKIFKKMDQSVAIDEAEILRVVLTTSPNTKTRKRAVMALSSLAHLAGIDVDLQPYAGNYAPSKVSPRDLPTDQAIAATRERITSPAWRWVFGMMATYGLRPHEVFRLDFDRLQSGDRVVQVLGNTKTGARECWPIYPEWFSAWALETVELPGIKLERSNSAIGHSVTEWFSDHSIPFPAYSLRHCWAVRSIVFGLPTELAARMMGHSVPVHTSIYHHWLTREHADRVWSLLMDRGDRPRPPTSPSPG